MRVTMTTTRHGDAEAHRTGCADLARRKNARGQEQPCDLGEFDTRLDVTADWFGDLIAENDATPADYLAEIHFAPCLADLP